MRMRNCVRRFWNNLRLFHPIAIANSHKTFFPEGAYSILPVRG